MDSKQLERLEGLRDDAAARAERAADELAQLEREWPAHDAPAVEDVKRQLRALAETWRQVKDWAAQQIRSDAERELM